MVKRLLIVFSVFGIILLTSYTSKSQSEVNRDTLLGGLNSLRVAVPFLTIAPDSRAGAMGDAGAATTPDVNSQHWNPAKYAFIDKEWGLSFSYTPWLRNLGVNDINLTYLTGFYRLDKEQVVGGSLLYFSMGEITATSRENQIISVMNPNEFAFDFSYSRKFADLISGAIAFRYIRSDLSNGISNNGSVIRAGNAFAADIAMYYNQPLVIDNRNAHAAFGMNISNMGSKISYNDDDKKDFIPINLRIGGRFSMDMDQYNTFSVVLDANKLLVPTPPATDDDDNIIAGMDTDVSILQGMIQSFYDAPGGGKEELREISYSLGIEYWYSKQFAIRAGYFHEHETKGGRKYFTVGAGLKYNVFNLDFAYLIPQVGFNSPLANTVRFSLMFDFERSRDRQKKE